MFDIFKVKGKTNYIALFISILISEGIGFLSALFSMGMMNIYNILKQPSFAPPSWVFGPVWFILYLLMGIAAYRIWMYGNKNEKVRDALFYYRTQLVFNFIWSILFFRLQLRGLAFIDIILLLIFILVTTVKFYKIDKKAAWLMIPYIIWVGFAAVLNFYVWILNK